LKQFIVGRFARSRDVSSTPTRSDSRNRVCVSGTLSLVGSMGDFLSLLIENNAALNPLVLQPLTTA